MYEEYKVRKLQEKYEQLKEAFTSYMLKADQKINSLEKRIELLENTK